MDVSVRDGDFREIQHSVFRGNSALEGGALKWRKVPMIFVNVSFVKNSATYGTDLASYGVKLVPAALSERVISGQWVELAFELQDFYGARVNTEWNTLLRLDASNSVSYSGNQVALARAGIFQFYGLKTFAPPASTQTLRVTFQEQMITGAVDVYFPNCTGGQIHHANMCEICKPGQVSYSPDDSSCIPCPVGAQCYGSKNMSLSSGYWRSAPNTTKVLRCPMKERCSWTTISECVPGFVGKFCSECAVGHYRWRYVECAECEDSLAHWLQLVLVPVGILGFMWVAVHCSLKAQNNCLFVLQAIINHIQLICMISPLKANFPDLIQYTLKASTQISSVAVINLPLACLGYTQVEFIKSIIGSFILLFFTLISCFFALLHLQHYRRVVGICVTSFWLFSPAICVHTLAPLFACEKTDTTVKWLFTDMSEECWQGLHLNLIYYLVLPSIVFNFILPWLLAVFIKLAHPEAFQSYFPMWCAGHTKPLWNLCQSVWKCVCLGLAIGSLAGTELSQVIYSLIALMTFSVINVALQKFMYKEGSFFAIVEVSQVVTVMNLGFGAFYMYNLPNNSVRDLCISILFIALNSGYAIWCIVLLLGQMLEKKITVEAQIEYDERSPVPLCVPKNSFM